MQTNPAINRQMLNAAGQAVLLEDFENPFLDDVDGMDRFQRTAPAVRGPNGGPIGNHIYAENPRKPNAGKQYLPIRYQHQDFPMAVYQKRIIPSVEVQMDLTALTAQKDATKRPKMWDDFMDRLIQIELQIDFRQLSLPETCPDITALRLLKRTLVLQIQAAESEEWIAKNQKTYAEFKIWAKTPIMRTVNSEEELKSLGRGWFKNPDCGPESELS